MKGNEFWVHCSTMSSRAGGCSPFGQTGSQCSLNVPKQQRFAAKFSRTVAFLGASVVLAMAVSHFCGRFLPSDSVRNIMSELHALKQNLMMLRKNVMNLHSSHHQLGQKFDEISKILPTLINVSIKMRDDISEQMTRHTQVLLRALAANFTKLRTEVQEGLSLYEADKIALTDYALESAGGRIVSIRNTEPYPAGAPPLKILGVQICHPTNAPQAIIQPGVLPGECWAFKGSAGAAVIRLVGHVRVSSVSLEHIPQSLSPTGEVSTAPKEFSVWGLSYADDMEGFFFGQFTYDIHGKPLQRFNVTHESKTPHPYVEVKFHSNHGNHEYTCVYRFRVHGTLELRPGVR